MSLKTSIAVLFCMVLIATSALAVRPEHAGRNDVCARKNSHAVHRVTAFLEQVVLRLGCDDDTGVRSSLCTIGDGHTVDCVGEDERSDDWPACPRLRISTRDESDWESDNDNDWSHSESDSDTDTGTDTDTDTETDTGTDTETDTGTDIDDTIVVCDAGFELGVAGTCVDIDECSFAYLVPVCGAHGSCVNIPGSFVCACERGYEIGVDGTCVEVIGSGNGGNDGRDDFPGELEPVEPVVDVEPEPAVESCTPGAKCRLPVIDEITREELPFKLGTCTDAGVCEIDVEATARDLLALALKLIGLVVAAVAGTAFMGLTWRLGFKKRKPAAVDPVDKVGSADAADAKLAEATEEQV